MDTWSTILLLLVAIGAIALGATLKLAWAAHQRWRTYTISDATIEDAWHRWIDGADLSGGERTLRGALLELLDGATLTAVHADLLRLESATIARSEPLAAVREELMASVDRRMLNAEIMRLPDELKSRLRAQSQDVLQSDDETRRYIAANEWRLHVLREYAALRYGDKTSNDWFAIYERAAQLKRRSLRAFFERALAGATTDPRADQIALVDHELRQRLLRVPPGTRFRSSTGAEATAT